MIRRVTFTTVLWLALGFSLGWYYTITYYGRAGWPMPMFELCGALVLYYFSVLNVETGIQAVHWMLVFPIAGAIWTATLVRIARRMGCAEARFSEWVLPLALSSLPLAAPGPVLAWLAGQTETGFDLERMLAVALRRGNLAPWPSLSPMYFSLGLFGLAGQVAFLLKRTNLRGLRFARYLLLAAIAATVSCIVAGVLAAAPARALGY